MSLVTADGNPREESNEAFQAFFEDPAYIHYIGMLLPPRPGVADTMQMLEFNHYRPNTPRNDLFQLRMVEWMEITWGIVSIPIAEKAFMEHIALVNSVRITDGVPTMFADGGMYRFPVDNPRIFTLENTRDHPIYQS